MANRLASAGQSVIIVEERDWGGTTINRGSTPKKALLAVAEAHHQLTQFQNNGFETVPAINWNQAGIIRDHLIMDESSRAKIGLLEKGVVTLEGHAEFVNRQTVSVNGQLYQSSKIVIATGARPRQLNFEGAQYVGHSASFLRAHILPQRVVFLGAGIIAFALAAIAAEAGAEVTIIQHNSMALRGFDQELVHQLIAQLQKKQVKFIFDQKIERVDRRNDQLVLTLKHDQQLAVDAIYNASGRVANVESLGLNRAGLQVTSRGIHVNQRLQTTTDNIWAIGDCNDAPVPKLSSYGTYQAKYLAQQLQQPTGDEIRYPVAASTVFSIPKLGQVGMPTQRAVQLPAEYEIKRIDASHWQNYAKNRDETAMIKLVIRKSDRRVVGATVLSHQADILTNDIALLLRNHVTLQEMQQTILAYPSLADDLYGIWS